MVPESEAEASMQKRLARQKKAAEVDLKEEFFGFSQGLKYSFSLFEIEIQEDWSGEGIKFFLLDQVELKINVK